MIASTQAKVDAIAQAQRDGVVPTHYSAQEIIALILHVAAIWAVPTPEQPAIVGTPSLASRRALVKDVIRRLLTD